MKTYEVAQHCILKTSPVKGGAKSGQWSCNPHATAWTKL